jgi:glycosyltransferase involved in cell wall biosynthesis
MRIACLAATDQLGGAEIALLEMIGSVRRHRPDWSFVVILPGTGPLLDACAREGISCEVLPFPAAIARIGESAMARQPWPSARPAATTQLLSAALRVPSHVRRLRRTLQRCNPSVIHSHGVKAHILGALCSERTPLIWHLHEYVSVRPVSLRLLRRLAHRCAAIVANSESVARDAQEAFRTVGAIRAIHNAVALERFDLHGDSIDLDRLSGLERPTQPIVRVGLISTFGRWKGHDTFLRALAELPPELPLRGYVIGEPLYRTAGSQHTRAALEDLASSLGVGKRVGFTGFQRADHALRALDIVVHASTEPEPFGLVIAEAMACGKPLVTTGLGGASEIISDGVDAFVTPPGDHRALAAAISRLASDSNLRGRLGRRARESALIRFNPERLAASLITLYEHSASQRPSQRVMGHGQGAMGHGQGAMGDGQRAMGNGQRAKSSARLEYR